jgi:hypothetical protein
MFYWVGVSDFCFLDQVEHLRLVLVEKWRDADEHLIKKNS